jgi:phosphate-selective porin OprO/OprP
LIIIILILIGTSSRAQDSAIQKFADDTVESISHYQEEVGPLDSNISILSLEETSNKPSSGYDGGFYIESPDGRFKLILEGLLQVHGRFFEPSLEGRNSEFFIRRMRFEIGGEIHNYYRFHVEPKFTEDKVELEEAWIGADFWESGPRLIIGRMKEPFSMEEMISLRHIDFIDFSILNQFVPAEDHGITVLGKTPGEHIEYGFAFYNGSGGNDLNSDKDVAGRLVIKPFASKENHWIRNFQFGGAITYGEQDEDISGEELKTEARVPFLAFEAGSRINGRRTRLGTEVAWLYGPVALMGEAITITQEMAGPEENFDDDTFGWSAATSWVLTGEKKTFKGVHPERPIDSSGDKKGTGAFQIAARYSSLLMDDDLITNGFVSEQTYPERVQSFDIGLNWYLTYHSRVKAHFLHTKYSQSILFEDEVRDVENALLLQFQLTF